MADRKQRLENRKKKREEGYEMSSATEESQRDAEENKGEISPSSNYRTEPTAAGSTVKQSKGKYLTGSFKTGKNKMHSQSVAGIEAEEERDEVNDLNFYNQNQRNEQSERIEEPGAEEIEPGRQQAYDTAEEDQ